MKQAGRILVLLAISVILSAAGYTCTIEQTSLPNQPDYPITVVYVSGPSDGPALLSVVLEYRDSRKELHRATSTAYQQNSPGQWQTEFGGFKDPVAAYVQGGI